MNENAQRKILLALAASPEEMSMPMIRRAAGLPDSKDIYPRLNNLIVSGAIRRRVSSSGERWFQLNLSWRSRYADIAYEVAQAVASRRASAVREPVVDEPPTPGADRPTARAVSAAPSRAPAAKVVRAERPAARPAPVAAPLPRECQGGLGTRRSPDADADDDVALGYAHPVDEFAGYSMPAKEPSVAAAEQRPVDAVVLDDVDIALDDSRGHTFVADAEDVVAPLGGDSHLQSLQEAAESDAVRRPFGLMARCHAVATDIEDLIGDACDRRLSHAAIKALALAQGAIRRAADALQEA